MPEVPIETEGPDDEPTYGLPKPNDSLFNFGKHYRENFQLNFHTQEHDYIRSFKEAADGVIQAAVDDSGDPSWRFLSACFLYRHFLELSLKRVIRRGCWMRGQDYSPADWQSHTLPKLWHEATHAMEKVLDPEYVPLIKVAERIVDEFHLIDPTGQELRYDTKISGRRDEPRVLTPSLEAVREKQVGMVNLHEVMARLDNLFAWVDKRISDWNAMYSRGM